MDEDNSGTPRVTRARSRRLSVLPDADGRSMTPVVDSTASPRPVRRTRLNSAAADLRTPTRATRSSLARGFTPEPTTPTVSLSAAKLSLRTPTTKSVVKKLPLPEEVIEEEVNQTAPTQQAKPNNGKIDGNKAEAALADSKNSPTNPDINKPLKTSPEKVTPVNTKNSYRRNTSSEKRVTRSMSNTPPMKNLTEPRLDMQNPSEEKQEAGKKMDAEIVNAPVEAQQSDLAITKESINSAATKEPMTAVLATAKVKVIVKDILTNGKEDNAQSIDDPNVSIVKKETDTPEDIEDKGETKNPADKRDAIPKAQDPEVPSVNDELKTGTIVPSVNDELETGNMEDENHTRRPNETPDLKGLLEGAKQAEPEKSVGFKNCGSAEDIIKPTYPKTPARTRVPVAELFNLAECKPESPLRPIPVKGRNSSTPLAKLDLSMSETTASTTSKEPNQPPSQIDMIKPLSELEVKAPVVHVTKENSLNRLDSDDDVVDDYDYVNEMDPAVAEYLVTEAEVADNYHSGDSMDSSLRAEIAANEIPHDGESVGSKDTTDDQSEDSADEKMSFIVSDNEDENEDKEIFSPLHFSSESEEEDADLEAPKKRRRIMVHDSSDDNQEMDEKNKDESVKSLKNDDSENGGQNDNADSNQENDIENDDVEGEKQINIEEPIGSNEKSVHVDDKEDIDTNEEQAEPLQLQPLKQAEKREQRLHLSVCESSQLKAKAVDRLNKTAPPIRFSVGEKIQKAEAEVAEYIVSSSDEEENQKDKPVTKKSINKSIYAVLDSEEESCEMDKEDQVDEDEERNSESEPSESESDDEEVDLTESPVVKAEESKQKKSASTSKSSTFHANQKHEDEAALLSELDSCDLSHLRQMFNPLQKSRRQTLYVQGSFLIEPKPKLKRRSEQLDSDVNPSQSFIETLAEESRQQTKRKRLSKSFCGTVDGLHKSGSAELPQSDIEIGKCEPDTVVKEEERESRAQPDSEIKELAKNLKKSDSKVYETVEGIKQKLPSATAVEKSFLAKGRDEYLEYCDTLILAANQAKLEEKKQRVAAGRKQRVRPISKTISTCVGNSNDTNAIETASPKLESGKLKIKKDLKRLQATTQAVKHAMHLLIPEAATNKPQSLARKLSPQPQENTKSAKTKQRSMSNKQKKNTLTQMSPVKSSDEENHQSPKIIRTTAGYVTVRNAKEPKHIKKFKTSSGMVQVEPSTPTSKYFREISQSPKPRHEFKQQKTIWKQSSSLSPSSSSVRNPATEAALRFKREVFGRRFK